MGDPAKLAIVGEDFAGTSQWIGVIAMTGLLWATYARTKRRAIETG